MTDFANFGAMARHFEQRARRVDPARRAELLSAGKQLETDARRLFGTYQPGWAQLAETTQAARAAAGYSPNDPLFVTGTLQGEVKSQAMTDNWVFAGVTAGKVVYGLHGQGKGIDVAYLMDVHERGTRDGRVPARPVFGIVVAGAARNAFAIGRGIAVRVFA